MTHIAAIEKLTSLFRPKPAHNQVRYVVPTKHELTEAQKLLQARQTSVRCQLAVYAATTTPEQRKAEADAYFAKARGLERKA